MYPYIPEREDMAEQAIGVGRGGATSRTIRAEWEARAGLLRRGRDGRRGARLGLLTSAGSSFGDLASMEFMELSHTYKEQGAARRGISERGLVDGQGWDMKGETYAGEAARGGSTGMKVDKKGSLAIGEWRKSGAGFGGGRKSGGGRTHPRSSWIPSVGFGSLGGKKENLPQTRRGVRGTSSKLCGKPG